MAPESKKEEKKREKLSEETVLGVESGTVQDVESEQDTSRRKLRPRESLKRPSDSTQISEVPAKKPATQRTKALETIFEEPLQKKGKELLFSNFKRVRALKISDGDNPSAAKQKQRRLKAKSFQQNKKLAEKA